MKDRFTVYCALFAFVVILIFVYYMGKNSSSSRSPYQGLGPVNTYDESADIVIDESDPNLNTPHPVLSYQRYASGMNHPANWGDPIRPMGIGSAPSGSGFHRAYGSGGSGPYPGGFMGIPIPQGSLKKTSEKFSYPFYYQKKPLSPYDFFKPYGPNQSSLQSEVVYADTPYYNNPLDIALQYTGTSSIPFIGSASSFAPFPEVQTPWEKTGMIQTVNPDNDTIMNLYRRPIAPLQDLWEYTVQDKDGFVVPLKARYLENGDIIKSVPGRENLGSWKVNIYNNNKWIWV